MAINGSSDICSVAVSTLAGTYAGTLPIGQRPALHDEAIAAVVTTKEKLFEADIYCVAGEIALLPPEPDAAKAEAYLGRALSVARLQTAKSWELRAAMSMARLWRDQGKRNEARDLLAPVYDWFTEGFDTIDLKKAKALLDESSA